MPLIDTHFHWYPRQYMQRLCERAGYPRAERAGGGYIYRYAGGDGYIELPAVWFDPDAGLEATEAVDGDWSVVCTAGVLSGLLDSLSRGEAMEAAIEYNEALAARQRQLPGRFWGTASVPLQNEADALEVLDDAIGRLRLVAVNLPPVAGDGPIDSPWLESFYERVAYLGVPLIVHPTDTGFGQILTGYERSMQLTIGRLLDSSVTVLRLLFSGILERHRGLRVVQTHAGGLLPYQAGRIDKNTTVSLGTDPSEQLAKLWVDTVAPQPLTIRAASEFYPPDHILFGTDYPCWSPAAALQTLQEAQLPAEVEQAIRVDNATRLFPIGSPLDAGSVGRLARS